MYGDKLLFGIGKQHGGRVMEIKASTSVKQNLSKEPGYIHLYSPNVARLLPVIDTISQTFIATADPRQSLLAGARMTDAVNVMIAEGTPPDTTCDCTEEQSRIELHHCASCLTLVYCYALTSNDNTLRICGPCVERRQQHGVEAKESLTEGMIRRSVRNSLRNEWKMIGANSDDALNVRIRDEIMDYAISQVQEGGKTYRDEYTQKLAIPPVEVPGFGRKVHPLVPSLDACFPIATAHGTVRAHLPGNVVITASMNNLITGLQVPGLLQELSVCLRKDPNSITLSLIHI